MPEEDPRFEFDVTEEVRRQANQEPWRKPGVARTPKELAEKVGTWIGLGLLVWGVLLGITIVTVKVIQSL